MTPQHAALVAELTALIPDRRAALRIARLAHLEVAAPRTGEVSDTWAAVVAAAETAHRIGILLDRAGEFADEPTLHSSVPQPVASIEDPLSEPDWAVFDEPDLSRYERQVGTRSTLLPVSFLRAGLTAARAVCKISYQRRDLTGVFRAVTGTGFLISPDELLTCFHVLPDVATAATATILFNYEADEHGAQLEAEEVRLDPGRGFQTSGSKVYDWTIVRTDGRVGDTYGYLNLTAVDAAGLDFVNIVGHPNGQLKQISLYDNLVERVDAARVLYTTETADGSSGSPVFDSQWRVVAMHNGWQQVFQRTMLRRVTRNAGININRIVERAGEFNSGALS